LLGIVIDGIHKDKIGNPYFANFTIGMNLEDWHPWEDYSDFFMSDKNKGGGALLDESHFIELIIELFGIPDYIFGIQKKISNLRITSDDYVNAKLQYRDLIVDLNLDLFKRPHESTIKIYGPRGSLICDLIKKTNLLTVYQEYAKFHEDYKIFTYDRNQVFQEMIRDFLIFVKSSTIKPKVPFSRGLQVMFLIDRIRESSATGSWVKVNGN
jgi:predicted dehydrogenase